MRLLQVALSNVTPSLPSPRNYIAAMCQVLEALLHTTPMKENDTGHKSRHCWSLAAL